MIEYCEVWENRAQSVELYLSIIHLINSKFLTLVCIVAQIKELQRIACSSRSASRNAASSVHPNHVATPTRTSIRQASSASGVGPLVNNVSTTAHPASHARPLGPAAIVLLCAMHARRSSRWAPEPQRTPRQHSLVTQLRTQPQHGTWRRPSRRSSAPTAAGLTPHHVRMAAADARPPGARLALRCPGT
jgi:hypothetical protein